MRQKLEYQAERIEAVLGLNKVNATVTGGTVTPRWTQFIITPQIGEKVSRIKNLSEEIAAALDAENCRVSRRGATVAVEVPRDDPQPVRLMPLYRQLVEGGDRPIPAVTSILGLGEDGTPLLIRLPSPDVAHVLVAGTTGSGKTVLLQAMALSLALTNRPPRPGQAPIAQECAFVMIDPKHRAFRQMADLPHLARPIIHTIEDSVEALNSLARLMERRDVKGERHPTIVVMIDELADLLMIGGKPVQSAITRLTQRGRDCGIHIVAATQKPTSAVLGPLVKANFPVRLVGRVTSVEDARTATGWSGTGAERLMGRGDFLAIAEGRVTRFQVAHVSGAEIIKVTRAIIHAPHLVVQSDNGGKPRGLRAILEAITTKATKQVEPDVGITVKTVKGNTEPDVIPPPTAVVTEAAPEPEPVLPQAPMPAGELQPVDLYEQRLREQGWDASQSFRAACRALNVPQGGRTFTDVKAAVKRLRVEQGLDPKTGKPVMEQGRKAIKFVTDQRDEDTAPPAAPATASEEKSPKPENGDERPFRECRGRTVALENQDDNDDVDQSKAVVIGLDAQVEWESTPHELANAVVGALKNYVQMEGEAHLIATNLVVEAIRADRRKTSVALV